VFRSVALQEDFPTFLTLSAYARYLVEGAAPAPQREFQTVFAAA
jgi:malate synthase